MKRLLAILALSYASSSVAVTHYGHGVPVSVGVQSNGIVYVYFDPATQVSGTIPACESYGGGALRVVFDSTTPGGKSMLATLLTAHGAGDLIFYFGSGDCALFGTDESLTSLNYNN
jgi:hypothetical protein